MGNSDIRATTGGGRLGKFEQALRDGQMRSLYAAGQSDNGIARALGVSSETVRRWRQRAGLSAQR
jgi:uncharacterized protein YjcR